MLRINPGENRALIYLRHSPKPEDKRTLDSLEAQRDACERYAKFVGLEIVHVMEQPFISAAKVPFMRRGGEEIIELSRRAAIRHVIAQRVDRLFRNTVDGLTSMQALRRARVDLHFADEGGSSLNCSTATGQFLFTMRLANAAYEPGLIGERTRQAMNRRIYNMMSHTNTPPYGFKNANNGKPERGEKSGKRCWPLEYCETEVRNLQLAHKWVVHDGLSFVEAAFALNQYAKQNRDKSYLRRNGREWEGRYLRRNYRDAQKRDSWWHLLAMLVDNPEPMDDWQREANGVDPELDAMDDSDGGSDDGGDGGDSTPDGEMPDWA